MLSNLWRQVCSNKQDDTVVMKRGCTPVEVTKFTLTWTINNFSLFCHDEVGETLRSPEFSTNASDLLWFLLVFPNGVNAKYSDHVAIFLTLGTRAKLNAKFSLSLLKQGKKVYSHSNTARIFDSRQYSTAWGLSNFIERKTLLDKENELLLDDSLTILCEITASFAVNSSAPDTAATSRWLQVPKCTLSDDLEQLLHRHSEFSDVTLVAAGHEFFAHKAILAARSSVFATMFKHDMTERKENRVNIADVEPAVLGAMLRYIYTGKKPAKLEELAQGLLAAADKYNLERLKVICEEVLLETISTDNVIDVLILADQHNAERLKQKAIRIVTKPRQDTADLFSTESWKNLVSSHPHLVNEALQSLMILSKLGGIENQ